MDCNNNNNNLQMNLSEQSSLSIFAQKLYFINAKIIILSYKISTYLLIYKDSFWVNILGDDCALKVLYCRFSRPQENDYSLYIENFNTGKVTP